jgi:hypothetical protein
MAQGLGKSDAGVSLFMIHEWDDLMKIEYRNGLGDG